jgi:hypothetical protein
VNDYAVDPFDMTAMTDGVLGTVRASKRDGHWLALVDTAFDHESEGLYWKKAIMPVYHQGRLERFQHVSPVLLELDTSSDEGLETEVKRLLRHCQGRPMLSFMHTRLPPQELIEGWQKIVEVQTEDGQLLLLRFADTRTLPTLAEVLKKTVWPILGYGIEQWHFIDRDGNLQQLELPDAEQSIPSDPPKIGDAELAEFSRLSLPDALVSAMREEFADLLPKATAADYRKLSAVCELAEKNGIDGFPDIMGLAVVIYSYGDQLLKHQKLAEWLGKKDWQEGQFMDALVAQVEALEGAEA